MTDEQETPSRDDAAEERYPVEPRYHPLHKSTRALYDFLASAKLAMFLLVAILAACLVGATVLREEDAGNAVFRSLWFNGLLVALIVNVSCCFFGRIWGRRVTVISFGMILFHLSFVTMFAGIIYNSLFYFRGILRVTEGETMPNGDPASYDLKESGRFFRYTRLTGETTLNRLETHYKVDGKDKRLAYDVSVGYPGFKKNGMIYLTHPLDYHGLGYFAEKQGYSVLAVICDRNGKELYGGHLPLQTLMRGKDDYFYTTGTKEAPGSLRFPAPPEAPLVDLQVELRPDQKQERTGEVTFRVRRLGADLMPAGEPVQGTVAVGALFDGGDYRFVVKEVRYWVGMKVTYEPGQPLVLTSLWAGLGGMLITFLGRMRRDKARGKTA